MTDRRTSTALGPVEVRRLSDELGVRPSKKWGQNFVHDANTVRRVVDAADLGRGECVLEVGPGLGSLTIPLLADERRVVAVDIDRRLTQALPGTVAAHVGEAAAQRLVVLTADVLSLGTDAILDAAGEPTALVANLPYNVSVPVLLHLLDTLPSLRTALVMVQAEVAARLTAVPGSRTYGAPTVKVAWYGAATPAGSVPRSVFWPVPNVDSALVRVVRRPPPSTPATSEQVFAVVSAAFAQRRKTLRSALAGWAGGPHEAQATLVAAGIDPMTRGERLTVEDFARIAASHRPR